MLASPAERELVPGAAPATSPPESIHPLAPGEQLHFGTLTVTPLATPGHTAGMLSLLVEGPGETPRVFTGDTLFRGSVGGVRAPGHTTIDDLRSSIMETLLALAPETVIEPGHADSTTVARELEQNPFVRIWRGLDAEGDAPCTALGDRADAGAARARLRRGHQGLGAVGRRQRRHRARLAGDAGRLTGGRL